MKNVKNGYYINGEIYVNSCDEFMETIENESLGNDEFSYLTIYPNKNGKLTFLGNNEGEVGGEIDTIGTFGTSQNVTSYYKSSAFTYSCVTGTNGFRQYIDPVDTSQGYSSELKYAENKENLAARFDILRKILS